MESLEVFVAVVFLFACVTGDGENLQGLASAPGVPTVDDAKAAFRQKCLTNANEEAWQYAEGAPERARACIQTLVNTTVLEQEIAQAKPTGDLDEVFKKYCRKSPQFQQCVRNFTASVRPCLEDSEKGTLRMVENIVSSLSEFVCYKDGDRIALFYAEQGPECLNDHKDDIKDCFNKTIISRSTTRDVALNSIPSFTTGTEQCKNFRLLQRCIVPKLEQCREPTPSNIIDALFSFIYRKVNCHTSA